MSDKARILITLPKAKGELLKRLAVEAGVATAQYAGLCISIGLKEMQQLMDKISPNLTDTND